MHAECHRVPDIADCGQPLVRQDQAPALEVQRLLVATLYQVSIPSLRNSAKYDDHRRGRGRPDQNPLILDRSRRQDRWGPRHQGQRAYDQCEATLPPCPVWHRVLP